MTEVELKCITTQAAVECRSRMITEDALCDIERLASEIRFLWAERARLTAERDHAQREAKVWRSTFR